MTEALWSVRNPGDGKLWCSSEKGKMYWSTDAITWHLSDPDIRGDGFKKRLYNIAYGGGKYVIGAYVTDNIADILNYNGASWSMKNIYGSGYTRAATYGKGIFVAAPDSGYISYSEDGGTSWKKGLKLPVAFSEMIYANNKFVLAGNKKIYYSDDGKTWQEATISGTNNGFLYDVCYGEGKFIAGGVNGSLFLSDNGESWIYSDALSNLDVVHGLAYGEGIFLASSEYAIIYASADKGNSWTKITDALGLANETYQNHLCYSSILKKYILSGNSGMIYTADWSESDAEAARYSSKLKFTDISNNIYNENIREETEFFIKSEQISNSKDSDGNYFVEFDMTNIKLISAEITNVPMTIPEQKSTSYTNAEIINETGSTENLWWGNRGGIGVSEDSLDLTTDATEGSNKMLKYESIMGTRSFSETIDCSQGGESGEILSYKAKMSNVSNSYSETLEFHFLNFLNFVFRNS